MAVSAFKTYSAGEVLTASDLNASFSQIHDNGEDLGWPATKAKDLDGNRIQWSSDQTTYSLEATGTANVLEHYAASTLVARWRLLSTVPSLEAYSADTDANPGPYLTMYRDVVGADNDELGDVRWYGQDTGSGEVLYARLNVDIQDAGTGSTDGRFRLYHHNAGSEQERIRIGAGDNMQLISQEADANAGPTLTLRRDSATPGDGDVGGRLAFDFDNDGNAQANLAYVQAVMETDASGSEDAYFQFSAKRGGSDAVSLSPGIQYNTALGTGTSFSLTGIPANARRVTLMFNAVSTDGSSALRITIGDSGGLETAGYNGCCSRLADGTANATTRSTAAAVIVTGVDASVGYSGVITFSLIDPSAHTWAWNGNMHATGGATDTAYTNAGTKDLDTALTQLQVTMNGSDVFDNGTIGVLVE